MAGEASREGFGAPLVRLPRGTRLLLRPMGQCLIRTFSSLRPQPPSRPPRSLRKARGFAEQVQSIEGKRFKEPTGLLLWAGEVSPRTTSRRRDTIAKGWEVSAEE